MPMNGILTPDGVDLRNFAAGSYEKSVIYWK